MTNNDDSTFCELCQEELLGEKIDSMNAHYQCALREVTGGIGHLIAHEWWCPGGKSGRDDPDAGLTYRQSALLVDAWVRVVGVEHLPQ